MRGAQACVLCRAEFSGPVPFEEHFRRIHYCGEFERRAQILVEEQPR